MATGIYYQINQQGPLEHFLLHGRSVAHFVCLMKFPYCKRR